MGVGLNYGNKYASKCNIHFCIQTKQKQQKFIFPSNKCPGWVLQIQVGALFHTVVQGPDSFHVKGLSRVSRLGC